jgi:pyruvate dehydrogenase (quinone)
MVKLEMMVDGIPDYDTDHEPTNFTAIAEGVGIDLARSNLRNIPRP